ncbi:MAG: S-methyl-5-thioribose-1-phosphate isomerase [Elusimicrobiota bacterium]
MKEIIEYKDGRLYLLDQRLLPHKEKYVENKNHEAVAESIKNMTVRGAPAIGITAAFGYCRGVKDFIEQKTSENNIDNFLKNVKSRLLKSRPTAVNLKWAVNKMEQKYIDLKQEPVDKIYSKLLNEARKLKESEVKANIDMGDYGADLLENIDGKNTDKLNLLTHCNAGALATGGWGTALGVMRTAHRRGLVRKVFADETRPRLQGARLTCYELGKENIPHKLIIDSMSGFLMKKGEIDAVVVGADRIAANGDVANKIGTYMSAVLADRHSIPFYVAAPVSTFDFDTETGRDIEIELRSPKEVLFINGRRIAPRETETKNYAFDITDSELIRGYITEKGVIKKTDELR